ncbi:MAG: response regulator, partial [Cytophagaceae bacterium]
MPQPVRILLVEDDEDDITFFELALKKQSIATQLTTLTDGDQVMPYLSDTAEHPDLLVLDLNLPKLPGRDVLTQLKQSPIGQDIPVVILSTSSAQEDS